MMTGHNYQNYVYTSIYYPQEPAYRVGFPDIPDIITSGDTLAGAIAHACEALDLHLESLRKLALPLPRSRHRLVVGSPESA